MGFGFLNKELVLYLVTNEGSLKDLSGRAMILGLFWSPGVKWIGVDRH